MDTAKVILAHVPTTLIDPNGDPYTLPRSTATLVVSQDEALLSLMAPTDLLE